MCLLLKPSNIKYQRSLPEYKADQDKIGQERREERDNSVEIPSFNDGQELFGIFFRESLNNEYLTGSAEDLVKVISIYSEVIPERIDDLLSGLTGPTENIRKNNNPNFNVYSTNSTP